MKIVILDLIGIPATAKHELKSLGADVYDDRPKNKAEIIDRIKDAEIITANYIDISSEIINAAPKLKYIIVPAVGFDWIDHEYAAERGIKVINCPTYVSLAVAEHALMLIFALARQLLEANSELRQGLWEPNKYAGFELDGKALGIVGYGSIGQRLEKLATGLSMPVNHVNSQSSPEDLDRLLKESDIVCLCLPLTKKTRHIIDERRLNLMKKTAYLINVARGAIVDQKALAKSLKDKQIAGAGLDVFDGEPLTGIPNDEIIELANLPNVVATPHTAWNTTGALERLGQEIVENIKACLKNKPTNVVN